MLLFSFAAGGQRLEWVVALEARRIRKVTGLNGEEYIAAHPCQKEKRTRREPVPLVGQLLALYRYHINIIRPQRKSPKHDTYSIWINSKGLAYSAAAISAQVIRLCKIYFPDRHVTNLTFRRLISTLAFSGEVKWNYPEEVNKDTFIGILATIQNHSAAIMKDVYNKSKDIRAAAAVLTAIQDQALQGGHSHRSHGMETEIQTQIADYQQAEEEIRLAEEKALRAMMQSDRNEREVVNPLNIEALKEDLKAQLNGYDEIHQQILAVLMARCDSFTTQEEYLAFRHRSHGDDENAVLPYLI